MITNPTQLLVQAATFPAAIEAKLPAGAPVLSQMLLDTAAKLPVVPDLPMEIPDLPAPPVLPEFPEFPTPAAGGGLRLPFVTQATVTPVQQRAEIIPSPVTGVLPEVIQRRGL